MWTELAQQFGLTSLALIATGRDHHKLRDMVGADRPAAGVDPGHCDLHPDALEFVATECRAGLVAVGVAGNQPAAIKQVLSAAACRRTSLRHRRRVAKPDPAFSSV